MLTGLTATWTKIIKEASSFAGQHGITDITIVERSKSKQCMAGEDVRDESDSREERLRVAMFIPELDQLIVQLQERFSDDQVGLMKEMSLFSSGALKSGYMISCADIQHLTQTYDLDSEAIVAEYRDFCTAFDCLNLTELCESYHMQIIEDQPVNSGVTSLEDKTVEVEQRQPTAGNGNNSGEDSGGEREETKDDEDDFPNELSPDDRKKKWILQNFIIPLKACYQLSGYPHLLRLYWILCTLPASSCSAERALSRLRIIKNRLRSAMCDDWMKALMVLASEKDILCTLTSEEIIDNYAVLSDRLKKQLLFV